MFLLSEDNSISRTPVEVEFRTQHLPSPGMPLLSVETQFQFGR